MIDTLPESLLRQARGGDPSKLGTLLDLYRNYLTLIARSQLDRGLEKRVDSSDLVQETFLEAHRDFGNFRGSSERELIVWLRRILIRNLTDQIRHHRAEKRDVKRQQSLEVDLDRSSVELFEALTTGAATPSEMVHRREHAVLLADAIEKLPTDYRDVILLRHIKRLKFDEIAVQMNRTAGAVRMLWVRALERLKHDLDWSP